MFLLSYLDGRRSNFPEQLDQILELFSMPNSQKNNVKRFQELKIKESLTPVEQTELNNLTTSLQHYIIDVEKWNFFGDVLFSMQSFFKTGVEPYIEDKKLEFQAEVDKLAARGEWQPNTQYFKKNIVTSGGEGYIAKLDSINQPPPNATYWSKIASKGAQGEPSLNISYKGAYDSAMAYVMGDAVTFGGLWYYAKQNTRGNPPTNAEFWELQANQVLVSDTEPFDNRIVGWIDTSI